MPWTEKCRSTSLALPFDGRLAGDLQRLIADGSPGESQGQEHCGERFAQGAILSGARNLGVEPEMIAYDKF